MKRFFIITGKVIELVQYFFPNASADRLPDLPTVFFQLCHGTQIKILVQIVECRAINYRQTYLSPDLAILGFQYIIELIFNIFLSQFALPVLACVSILVVGPAAAHMSGIRICGSRPAPNSHRVLGRQRLDFHQICPKQVL